MNHQVVLSRSYSIVERLLDKRAKLELTDDKGRMALHWAAKIAERSIVEAPTKHRIPNQVPNEYLELKTKQATPLSIMQLQPETLRFSDC
jgi:ankyrin repeat protein